MSAPTQTAPVTVAAVWLRLSALLLAAGRRTAELIHRALLLIPEIGRAHV